jgi:sec-independent protein translocase protein TatA
MNGILIGVVGPWQIILVVVIALLLFGGKKIPELMKGVGQGIKEFKDGMNTDSNNNKPQDKIQEKKKDLDNDKPLF